MGPRALGELTWTALDVAADERPLLVLPCGSTEQHGPHLPLDTDTRIALALARRLATGQEPAAGDRRPMVVAPPIPFGASGEHQDFPGTASIGSDALARVVTELVRSVRSWCAGVICVSAHGGNADALATAAATAVAEGDRLLVWPVTVPGGDAHAGRTETSLMLAIEPVAVRLEVAQAGPTAPVGRLLERLRSGGVRSVSANGVLGDPAGASAEEGCRLLADLDRRLSTAVSAWLETEVV